MFELKTANDKKCTMSKTGIRGNNPNTANLCGKIASFPTLKIMLGNWFATMGKGKKSDREFVIFTLEKL